MRRAWPCFETKRRPDGGLSRSAGAQEMRPREASVIYRARAAMYYRRSAKFRDHQQRLHRGLLRFGVVFCLGQLGDVLCRIPELATEDRIVIDFGLADGEARRRALLPLVAEG